jgi:hypothetical protein
MAFRAASRVAPDEVAPVAKLAREVDALKAALAKAEAKLADDPGETAKLERQLKAAKTRASNEAASARRAWAAARSNGTAIKKSDHNKIAKFFHPDANSDATPEQRKKLEDVMKVINAAKFNIIPD